MKNKIFTRIIITTLLCAFLTLNVGKVTRVSAVGTTIAASAAAALCAVGVVYCSYMALTGASMHVPDTVENIETWLTDIGNKVVQYPSGREAYEELYPQFLRSPAGNLIHDFLDSEAWTWTADKIKLWANDFSSTTVINDIVSYDTFVSNLVTNGYEYTYNMTTLPDTIRMNGSNYTFEQLESQGWSFTFPSGIQVVETANGNGYVLPTTLTGEYRNYHSTNGYFYIQHFVNGTWTNTSITFSEQINMDNGSMHYYLNPSPAQDWYAFSTNSGTVTKSNPQTYPIFPNLAVYDEALQDYLPMSQTHELVKYSPQWPTLPPEDDNKPVVPYVKLPYDPSWIDPITNLPTGGGNWGFNLGRLLDALEDLAGLMMEIGAIGELINEFKDLVGDDYYIYYNEGDDYYYDYYTITNFADNTYNYDINVSEVDEHLPVDLNTIQTYSSNRYLEQIKQSAINGSSIVRDLAVFWYDVDPEVTYIALGICIVILIGAFTGKLGHS